MNTVIEKKSSLCGTITVPGDKSISHRAVMFGALAKGETRIHGFLNGADCLSTISCFRQMGIHIETDGTFVTVQGNGLHGLKAPNGTLDVGNSGTTIRLLSGILSGQDFCSVISGDASIQKRPMDRVALPLREMDAQIKGRQDSQKILAPLTITGSKLKGITYRLPVASAQVKSAILLASLYADGVTEVIEPEKTRDHTEIMLNYLGADIKRDGARIISTPVAELRAKEIHVPGDISSAAYFMVAALLSPDSCLRINNVGLNPTRGGIVKVLREMGGKIILENEKFTCGERTADVIVETSSLHGVTVGGEIIPTLIDEIPIIAVAAVFAQGTTVIKDAGELKVKESNRIQTIVTELKKFGADIEETEDGMIIHGGSPLNGAHCESYHDHRIAMSMAICGIMTGNTVIQEANCVDISFPGFFSVLASL